MVIREYSSSFGLASRLLAEPVRTRCATSTRWSGSPTRSSTTPTPPSGASRGPRMLTWLHEDVRHALQTGYSGNLVVHAFARTAVGCGIGDELVDPFFASMRMDLDTTVHTRESFDRYVYGSAEVVGLMCLRVFLAGDRAEATDGRVDYDRLAPGARRLGAAFQKLNFLRDLAEDHDTLGRRYFPGLDVERFCDADRDRILDDITADLDAAAAVVPELPASSRRAVRVAHATFAELAARLRATPAAEIRRTRVRVPDPVKVRLVAGALYGAARDLAPARPVDQPVDGGRGDGARRVVVIGGGIAGLATAALLASRGHSVDLLEKNDELGGRVGSIERDGFRFDTGASWYLMPEVFEHFFSLLGTSADAELELTVLDPSYRVFFEGHPEPVDVRPDRAHNRALFESLEPGAGARFDAYLRSAEETYDIALRRFLYSNFDSAVGLPAPRRRPPDPGAGPAADPVARQPRGGAVLRQPAPPGAGLSRCVPRLVPEPGAEHVPPDEPARPRRPGALPAGRVHAAHRGDRRAGRAARSPAAHRHARSPGSSPVTAPAVAGAQVTGVEHIANGGRDRRTFAADVVVGAADLHHLETALLPSSLQTHPQQVWRRRSPGPGAVLAMLGVEGRLPAARPPLAVLHLRLGPQLRRHLRSRRPRPGPRVDLRLQALRERPDRGARRVREPLRPGAGAGRRVHRPGRRRRAGVRGGGADGRRGDRPGGRVGRGPRTCATASGCGTPSGPRTSPAATTRGAAGRSASSTRSARARSSGRATCRPRSTGCCTPGQVPFPGWDCRCA